MRLREILKGLKVEKKVGNLDIEIKGISDDSRLVKPGFLFIAIKGYHQDGHKFIMEAIRKGAVALVLEEELNFPYPCWIKVENSREFLSFIAHRFYGEPTKEMNITGITGTNGKTTTSYIISELLNLRGGKTGIIGTIKYIWGKREVPSSLTTPFPLTLFEIMSSMRKEGIKNIVMEVSSHSLATGRVEAVNFNSVIFTNLTRDHMDFHKSFKDYFKSKLKLIEILKRSIKENKKVIYNIDDPYFSRITPFEGISFVSFGKSSEAKIRAIKVNSTWKGINFIVTDGEDKESLFVPLVGEFNIYNALAAISFAREEGFEWEEIRKGLLNINKVPGRFEILERGGIKAIVDYAHTPDALKNLLLSVRKLTRGKVITVFGCGGDRDKGKRKIMGEISSLLSDVVFITSDNPRSEDPLKIINEIKKGIKNGEYYKIPDRGEAIKKAILVADKGDSVVIAGKGHENYQVWKDTVIPFNDAEVVKKELKNRFVEKVKV